MIAEVTLIQIVKLFLLVILSGALLFLFFRSLKLAGVEKIRFRTLISLPFLAGTVFLLGMPPHPMIPLIGALFGLGLAIIWGKPLILLVTKPFLDPFMPSEELEASANFSPAIRMRNQGLYSQALESIDKELEEFPTNIQGHLLKAQIWAKHRQEPTEALAILEEYLAKDPLPSVGSQIVALTQLAEISLNYLKDKSRAKAYFQIIVERFPDSEAANEAEQRIAQLSIATATKATEPIKKLTVTNDNRDYGLEFGRDYVHENLKKSVDDLSLDDLAAHLHEHPKNFSARRELVQRLAFEADDPSEAMRFIQEALEIPHQSIKQRADWYHLLVDIQIRKLQNITAAQLTLKRLINEDPDCAMAEIAKKRIAMLKREMDVLQNKSVIQIGEYEQDIGIKRKPQSSPRTQT